MTFGEVHRLIKKGDVIRLRKALDDGLDPNLANAFGATVLMLAALHGDSQVGRLLIDFGAAVDAQNSHGDTALSLAGFGSAAFFKMLLTKGAALEFGSPSRPIENHLDWLSDFYPERIGSMQRAVAEERQVRAKRDEVIEGLTRHERADE